MGILSNIFAGGFGSIIKGVKDIADEFHLSGEEKNSFIAKMEGLFQKRDSEIEQTIRTELNAKMEVIKSEMAQGDKFTKRARPSVVYVGLSVIVVNYCLAPIIAGFFKVKLPTLDLPLEFWVAWGGIVSTWAIGRSAEKRGVRNKTISAITGSSILD